MTIFKKRPRGERKKASEAQGKHTTFQCTSATYKPHTTLVAWILHPRILGDLRGIEIFGGMGGEWIESKICFPLWLDMVVRSYTIMLEVAARWWSKDQGASSL